MASIAAKDIQMFYANELKTVSPNTVIHEHANIHRALKYAVKMDLIDFNHADKVDRPKKQKYIAEHYNLEELAALFEATKTHYLGLLIQVTAFYGLRRSEVLGLKWDAIDFENKTITIKHILTSVKLDGKQTIVRDDRTKTKSSLRSLPLVPRFETAFKELKKQQEENRRVCGDCYCTEYLDYIFVNGLGKIYNPNMVTEVFGKIIKANGLRKIRFHDLRHSCASLLLANGVTIKNTKKEINDYIEAKHYFDSLHLDRKLPTMKELNEEFQAVLKKKHETYNELFPLKKEHRKHLIYRENVKVLLDIDINQRQRSKSYER